MGSDSLKVSSGTAVKQALRRNLSLNPALALWDGGKNHESPAGYFLMCKVGCRMSDLLSYYSQAKVGPA